MVNKLETTNLNWSLKILRTNQVKTDDNSLEIKEEDDINTYNNFEKEEQKENKRFQ